MQLPMNVNAYQHVTPRIRIGCLLEKETYCTAMQRVQGFEVLPLWGDKLEQLSVKNFDYVLCDLANLEIIELEGQEHFIKDSKVPFYLILRAMENIPARILINPLVTRHIVLSSPRYDELEPLSSIINSLLTAENEANLRIDHEGTLFLKKVNSLIDRFLEMNNPYVNDVAENLSMSAKTLGRKIKALTGLSTVQYILRHRLAKARAMLVKGEISAQDAAVKTGFISYSYFAKSFKKAFGELPSSYTRQ